MKNTAIFILLMFFISLSLSAQNYSPCYTNNISKGDVAFKQGKYSEAKTYYATAKQCAGGNPSAAQQKINQCNAKLNSAPRPTQSLSYIPKTDQTFTVNGISFKMVYVQGGTFTMGCTSEQGSDCYDDREKPIHSVTLSDFLIGETEVTQSLWEAVMGTTVREQHDKANPSWSMHGEGANCPMYYVTWFEAVEFCKKLNEKLRSQLPSGCRFALPTEAQWEYAARGGNKSQHYKYAGSDNLNEVTWYGNAAIDERSKFVKTKKANELGLYDMSGSVWEWCSDWYGDYSSSAQTNPRGSSTGLHRVLRGGSFSSGAIWCRVSSRINYEPAGRYGDHGFRLVLVRQ